ncbi:hypothetical protein NKR19_g245 [Coniochaeta hoffmannii]|uniref:Uncharacterized protein n=1 Tax=Coniochaeta hoffmannii TaxID=91930 RepID=A0AA38S369_9PEZI|nr:hypothetical protein NKR19_g245 [Coniochaeta hoffmannii]
MADLDEESVRDRWKGFVSKWNAGELERSWYEPEMFLRVVRLRALEEARVRAAASSSNRRDGEPAVMTPPPTGVSFASEVMDSVVSDTTSFAGTPAVVDGDAEDDEDEYAPLLPPAQQARATHPSTIIPPPASASVLKPGPTIPTLSDLELRRTLSSESRSASLSSLRLSRGADLALQKERLDDLLPRADPGTRERKLEKRRLATEAMREFASSRGEGGEAAEVPEAELLGGDGADDDYRRMLEGMRRRRTEREVRREEVARARDAEREGRVREARAREEERVGVLREMARRRFG